MLLIVKNNCDSKAHIIKIQEQKDTIYVIKPQILLRTDKSTALQLLASIVKFGLDFGILKIISALSLKFC